MRYEFLRINCIKECDTDIKELSFIFKFNYLATLKFINRIQLCIIHLTGG